jgi:predicted kinase
MQQLLAANIAANEDLIRSAGGSATAAVLDWGDLLGSSSSEGELGLSSSRASTSTSSSCAVLRQIGSWEWAMGADLVYNAGQVQPVVRMLATLLAENTRSSSSRLAGSNISGSDSGTRCAGFLLAHKQRHQQVDQQLQKALHLAGLRVAVVAQQQQQQGHCCHQHEQQQDHGQQHTGLPDGSTHPLDAAHFPEHTSGGVIIWWITSAHSLRVASDAAQAQATVQHGSQQQQNCEQPEHMAEQMPQIQQQYGQLQQPAGATEQPGRISEQARQRPTREPLPQRGPTESNQQRQQQPLEPQSQKAEMQPQRPFAVPQQHTQQQGQQQQLPRKLLLLSAGLAGVGKSTVLRLLSNRLGSGCVYLDKDTINQALLGGQPYFSEYYKQHVQQQTYAVMFGIAADNLAARQQCVVLLDGQFGDKLTAQYVQPYLRAMRAGQALHFGQYPANSSARSLEDYQQQEQQQQQHCQQQPEFNPCCFEAAGLQELAAQQQPEDVSSTRGCMIVLLLFDTGGCGDLQLERLQARGLARDEGKYAAFEQYRRQETQMLQQQLKLAVAAGLLDDIVEVDTSQSPAACSEHIIRQLALLEGTL